MSVKLVKDQLEAGIITPEQAVVQAEQEIVKRSVYRPPTREEKLKRYQKDKDRKLFAMQKALPFVHPEFSRRFRLVQGLYLIGGVSGHGKSTTLRNLLAGYADLGSGRDVTVITNEESSMTVYDGVSCVLLDKDFSAHQNLRNSHSDRSAIEAKSAELMEFITVEAGDSQFDMSCAEDVRLVLEHAEERKSGLVLIDYWQTITHSRDDEEMETFRVLKDLGHYLKEYGRRATVPICVFVQLANKGDSKDFKSRVENDKTIYNHAFGAIEIIPNFENKTTKFLIHKDRNCNATGEIVEMNWVNGRYEIAGGGI
jgi:predicted ATP-dependent serine protease